MNNETQHNTSDYSQQRKLLAVMFTDIKDFSKKMQENEIAAMHMLETHDEMMSNVVEKHGGNVIKRIGDAFLVTFESVVNATQCAVEAQQNFHLYNKGKTELEKIVVRIGVHLGDVIFKGSDVFGDGVNIASRIQSIAEPGGVNITGSVLEQVKNKLDIHTVALGVPQLKNIKEQVKVFNIIVDPDAKTRGRISTDILIFKTIITRKRTMALIGSIVVLLGTVFGVWQYTRTPVSKTLAVIPFESTSKDENEYIVDGLTDECIERLSKSSQAMVISRISSFFYNGKQLPEQQIAKELDVRFTVSGTVRFNNEQLKISVQLTDWVKQKILWNEKYEITKSEILQVQSDIPHRIASFLKFELDESEMKTTSEVNDLYLRGLYEVRKSKRENNITAITYFSNAIEKDSLFAKAYVELANAQLFFNEWNWDIDEKWILESEKNCMKALAIDSNVIGALGVLGRIFIAQGNIQDGIRLLEQSLKQNPNDVSSLSTLGKIYAFQLNNPMKAVNYFTNAAELEPNNALTISNLGVGYAMLNNNFDAIRTFRRALVLKPDDYMSLQNLGLVFETISQYDSAIISYSASLASNPLNAQTRVSLATLLIYQSFYARAESLLITGIQLEPSHYNYYYELGIVQEIMKKKMQSTASFTRGLNQSLNEINRNKSYSEPYLFAGLFYARLGKGDDAIRYGNNAFAIDSSSDNAIGIARIYAILGNKSLTLQWFQKAKTMAPDFNEAYLRLALDFEKFKNDDELLQLARR